MAKEGVEPPTADPGSTPKEVEELVNAVCCHALALVLLARETTQRGVRVRQRPRGTLRDIMAYLERKHPGERENSLYASLGLSLRRMTGDGRQRIRFLGAFHGGAGLIALAQFFDLDANIAERLHNELIDVGLAGAWSNCSTNWTARAP
jgi:hypothetical protein